MSNENRKEKLISMQKETTAPATEAVKKDSPERFGESFCGAVLNGKLIVLP